ncbi:MAG: hypothetical protein WBJ81_00950 [Rickettsiales bacterium]
MTTYQLYSLGQISKANIAKSFSSFSKILQEENSYSPLFAYSMVVYAKLLDDWHYNTINTYKLGNINSTEFTARISSQLGIKNTPKVIDAWNSMCAMDNNTKANIIKLFKTLEQADFKIAIFPISNPLQYNNVTSEMNLLLEANNLPLLENNPKVAIYKSFEENTLDIVTLAKKFITENILDTQESIICTTLDPITYKNLDLHQAQFYKEDYIGKIAAEHDEV